MKIYQVWYQDYENSFYHGTYSTQELAEEKVKKVEGSKYKNTCSILIFEIDSEDEKIGLVKR